MRPLAWAMAALLLAGPVWAQEAHRVIPQPPHQDQAPGAAGPATEPETPPDTGSETGSDAAPATALEAGPDPSDVAAPDTTPEKPTEAAPDAAAEPAPEAAGGESPSSAPNTAPDAVAAPAPETAGGESPRSAPDTAPGPEPEAPPVAPRLEASLDPAETMPGQPAILRLTLLVPTYLPDAPLWPSFEAPNLQVALLASGPASGTVEGQSWSGISRRYALTPLVPGAIELPPQPLRVTWADPETNAPRQSELEIPALRLSATLPEGAEGLEPFIVATGLTLSQEIEGDPEALAPGQALTRIVTARIEGGLPMTLPPLTPEAALPGLRAYPDPPALEEGAEAAAGPGGLRRERVVYGAEAGGAGELPEITLDWYNSSSGAIETARLEPVPYRISGPARPGAGGDGPHWARWGLAVAFGLALALLLWRLRRPVQLVWARAQARRRGSEAYAWGQLKSVLKARDYSALHPALGLWAARLDGPDPRQSPALQQALLGLGEARFGGATAQDGGHAWAALAKALSQARIAAHGPTERAQLPPLNP